MHFYLNSPLKTERSYTDKELDLIAKLVNEDKKFGVFDFWSELNDGSFCRENFSHDSFLHGNGKILLGPDFVDDLEKKYGDIFERKIKEKDSKSKNILLYGFAFLIFFVFGLMIGGAV